LADIIRLRGSDVKDRNFNEIARIPGADGFFGGSLQFFPNILKDMILSIRVGY
jgi:hypothetical protein